MIRFGNWRPQANRNIQICLHRTKQLHFHTFRTYPNKDTLHIHSDSLLVDGLNFSKYIEIADCYMKYDDRVYWKWTENTLLHNYFCFNKQDSRERLANQNGVMWWPSVCFWGTSHDKQSPNMTGHTFDTWLSFIPFHHFPHQNVLPFLKCFIRFPYFPSCAFPVDSSLDSF